jgi:hypothetical protein
MQVLNSSAPTAATNAAARLASDPVIGKLASQGTTASASASSTIARNASSLSFTQSLSTIVRTQGIRGLYRGFPVNITGLSMDPVFITCLETVRTQLTHYQKQQSLRDHIVYKHLLTDGAISMIAGGTAAMAAQTALVPIDIITQKLQCDSSLTTRKIVRDIIAQDGILRGMYKGYFLTILATTPYNALVWSFYWQIQNVAKQYFKANPLKQQNHQQFTNTQYVMQSIPQLHSTNPPVTQIAQSDWRELVTAPLSSCIAATLASLATQPADVLKTRLQVQEKRTPLLHTLRVLIAEKGVAGLMSGSVARIAVVMPGSVIMMSCYESIKRKCVALPSVDRNSMHAHQLTGRNTLV